MGKHDEWSWVVVRTMILELRSLIAEFHSGQRLCITAFDSGPITPSPEEQCLGWSLIGAIMVSPPLTPHLEIPADEYDEWYVFESLPTSIDIAERYVNYSGFNLADPQAMAASQGPNWDRTIYDCLVPIQARFWSDMNRLDPSSYISSGCNDIVVSRNAAFVNRVVDAARQQIVG